MQTKSIHVYDGGVCRRGRPEGYPSPTFFDLGSSHDDEIGGPLFVAGKSRWGRIQGIGEIT
jgi:hypothetical protein